jgi:uncharacterized membrane protein
VTWYYALGGDRLGPVDEAAFERLIGDGTIGPDTLVWRDGMAGWQPLRDVRPAAAAAPAVVPVSGAASGLGSIPGAAPTPAQAPTSSAAAAKAATFPYSWGASGSTPLPGAPTLDPEVELARIVSRGRTFSPIDAIKRAIALVMEEPLQAVGVTLVGMLTLGVCGFLPCVGAIAQIIATGPVVAGWQLYFMRRLRGMPATPWDLFEPFASPQLSQLVIEYVVTTAFSFCLVLPLIGLGFLTIPLAAAADELAGFILITGWGMVGLIGLAGSLFLTVAFMFALPLILDKGLPFWPAMQLSRRVAQRYFLPLVGLLLLCWLIMLAGILALCVGILIAAPVVMASMTCAYEDLFGEGSTAP